MQNANTTTGLLDQKPTTQRFLTEVMGGLSRVPKRLPSKYFYDARGSQLFDEICRLEEYYLTRCEDWIIKRYVSEMAAAIGPGVMLVEYGSGSSHKTRALLDALEDPVAYVPVDISREHLRSTAQRLKTQHPEIEILPVCADFTEPFRLPVSRRPPTHAAVFFPGSTIGNFETPAACAILQQVADLCGRGGGLLIGIDLQKEVSTIEAAYNDAQGVTAEFNLNLLRHINQELDARFDLEQYTHQAVYDNQFHRVELSLVSDRSQSVRLGGRKFHFAHGEAIITEYSHKYTIAGFAEMASRAGLTLRRSWTDDCGMFAVLHFALLD